MTLLQYLLLYSFLSVTKINVLHALNNALTYVTSGIRDSKHVFVPKANIF